ncbi:hypothetical protein CC78DRAFT_474845, partial [Lojkania enalia]
KWLEAHGLLESWKQLFIRRLYRGFPTGEYMNGSECQTLLPHIGSAATWQLEEESLVAEWAVFLCRAAWRA